MKHSVALGALRFGSRRAILEDLGGDVRILGQAVLPPWLPRSGLGEVVVPRQCGNAELG